MKIDPEFDYAEAHSPDLWRILGVKLLPFKVGHRLILQRVKSPFIFQSSGDPKLEDLLFAVWVCSRPYNEARHYVSKKLSLGWRIRLSRVTRDMEKNNELFQSRVDMFFNYLIESMQRPARMRIVRSESLDVPEPEPTFAPSLMVLKRDLMGKICFCEDAFFEMSLRLAYFERWAQCEKEGQVTWPELWEGS